MKEQMEEVRVWKKSRSPGGGYVGGIGVKSAPISPYQFPFCGAEPQRERLLVCLSTPPEVEKGPVAEGERQMVDSLGSQGGTEPVRAQEQIQRIIDIGAEKIGGG